MKRTILSILLAGYMLVGFAQTKDTILVITQDTTSKSSERKKTKTFSVTIKTKSDSSKTETKKPSSKFSIALTFSRIDIGLSRIIDNGSFNLSGANSNLETDKAINFGFEFLQTGYRFNNNFKIYLSAGLDWTHLYLNKNVTILEDQPVLTFVNEPIKFHKNRFSSRYLRVPLNFQFRTNDDKKGNKFYIVAGPEIGFLLDGKVKQISGERGKEKFRDDYNLEQLRYGAFARFGYGSLGIYSKYYFNNMFAEGQGPSNLNNFSIGLMLGF